MTKYSYYLLLSCLMFLAGCQTVEPLAIDYMLPADVSFPPSLKRVAIVNNMPEVPDNKPILAKEKKKDDFEIASKTDYYNGNAAIATESLAEALAHENYFNEVVICDSALRAHDVTPREGALSQEETNRLVHDLDVDFLIALENVQIRSVRKIKYMRDWGIYYGTVDARIYPTVRIYLPNRSTPMATINANDSIFWEETGNGPFVQGNLISEEELIKQGKIKRDKKESVIFKGDDNSYYEKYGEKLPSGWVVTNFETLLSYEQPTNYIVKDTNYKSKYETPVLTAGKSFILGYTDEKENIFSELPVIIFDDFTTESKFVDFPFKVKSSAMKILHINTDLVLPKFAFYLIQATQIDHDNHQRYWISTYSQELLGLPPINEQKRILSALELYFALIEMIS